MDPVGFLDSYPGRLLAVDEVQCVPELVLALKLIVDRDQRPGRFLLTGSANLLNLPMVGDSLAGRTESINLYGISQGEINGHKERFIDRTLSGERFLDYSTNLSRNDYMEIVTTGGFPEVIARRTGSRRNIWFDNYSNAIVRRDAEEITNLHRISELPTILKILAARSSGELNIADVSRDTSIPQRTLVPYLELLQTLYLAQHIPAWRTNLAQRVVSRPKVALLDSGLTARLMNVSASALSQTVSPHLAGGLLEGFVAGEISRQMTWSYERLELSHFRDQNAGEVDLILETPDGRVVGIEVKATSTPVPRDAKGLIYLRDRLGSRFISGIILHTGSSSASFVDRITALPLDALWKT